MAQVICLLCRVPVSVSGWNFQHPRPPQNDVYWASVGTIAHSAVQPRCIVIVIEDGKQNTRWQRPSYILFYATSLLWNVSKYSIHSKYCIPQIHPTPSHGYYYCCYYLLLLLSQSPETLDYAFPIKHLNPTKEKKNFFRLDKALTVRLTMTSKLIHVQNCWGSH